jgi:hypothetical protein
MVASEAMNAMGEGQQRFWEDSAARWRRMAPSSYGAKPGQGDQVFLDKALLDAQKGEGWGKFSDAAGYAGAGIDVIFAVGSVYQVYRCEGNWYRELTVQMGGLAGEIAGGALCSAIGWSGVPLFVCSVAAATVGERLGEDLAAVLYDESEVAARKAKDCALDWSVPPLRCLVPGGPDDFNFWRPGG